MPLNVFKDGSIAAYDRNIAKLRDNFPLILEIFCCISSDCAIQRGTIPTGAGTACDTIELWERNPPTAGWKNCTPSASAWPRSRSANIDAVVWSCSPEPGCHAPCLGRPNVYGTVLGCSDADCLEGRLT